MTSRDNSATRTSRPPRPAATQPGQAGAQAAAAEFAERVYSAATVSRSAGGAGVSVQSLYNDWGNKRNLLEAVLQTAVTGDDEASLTPGKPPEVITATLGLDDGAD